MLVILLSMPRIQVSHYIMKSIKNMFVFVVVESESEPEDVAPQVLRSLLHPVRRFHRPRGGDEQRAAASHEDALQVRPEGFLVQTPRLTQRARQVLAHVQRPGLPGNARGPAL